MIKASKYTTYHSTILSALRRYTAQYQELLQEVENYQPESVSPNTDIDFAYFERFGFSVDESRMVVILLSHNFIEALANFNLALQTNEEVFQLLESASVIEKWATIPRLFVPDYELPKGEQIYQDLKLLVTRRNAITHMKPEIVVDGLRMHKGNVPKGIRNEHKFVMNCVSLPLRLLKNLGKYDRCL